MHSQTERLRVDFDKGRKHTIFTAMQSLGIGALHQRCNELKERGYRVKRELIKRRGRTLAQFCKG